ncbi:MULTISPECIES: Fe-S cluster assembly protein SufB [Thermotoga]|uniref:Iron-regulated ABC transporter membrane component SufB n=1 Tax=Thermotoga neapolitana (strain ATCC 49049 / DSM 4359 / NBRC 107923 / NS-E) TaxID=309803 RepID=B9K8W5_THENN|nr:MULTISPECIES: Fe-S cluster assembly protein SufB [Thermotoga]MDK2785882.1 Fe-S cluster assembly protein SufB [Thermotoga sp.]HBF11251.1 Fe-S cluster assembly protein SufB [Thermotoga neapolitana]ACM23398.1 Iron-regulated ABC transporter membrane component SufB [Thermotoga neapolitana DSM 4359]AJG41308.1 Fe-S cluster assembly protein SufB [Thermotoga sp. RQ7]MDK2950002.1 Fe-S cluster assembly protein SufB [Thermotoga sp.]
MMERIIIDDSRFNFIPKVRTAYKAPPGLNERLIEEISHAKGEPEWMLKHRLESLKIFKEWHNPRFGVDISELDLGKIVSYIRPDAKKGTSWEEVPEEVKEAFDKLGIPEAERKYLAGVGAQLDSEIVYQNIKKELEKLGVIFLDMESAVREYPDLVKEYFMKLVPSTDHKFAALHGAIWSGGTFLYVPANVKVPMPLQAYFLMSNPGMGQFEHTIIVAEEGSEVTFIEGCSAPRYNVINLHAGMVEIYVKRGAKVKYLTIQNWSKNTYNLNTKRSIVEEEGSMTWVSGSLGSYKTMLYPMTILKGKGARAESMSITYAGPGQHMDTGSKVVHLAPYTSSLVSAKSISLGGGWAFYRGLLKITKEAENSKASVECAALMLDNRSKSDTVPIIEVETDRADVGHEARIGRIGEDQIFYLMSRGLSEQEAKSMIVKGFVEPVVKELPFEYAVELNKLLELEIEKSIG